jgi:hypothetical protein
MMRGYGRAPSWLCRSRQLKGVSPGTTGVRRQVDPPRPPPIWHMFARSAKVLIRHPETPETSGRSAVGSASPCQGEGRGFESRRPLGDAATHVGGNLGGVAERRGNGLQSRLHGFESRLHLGKEMRGRLAQWERASLTRKRSLVQTQYRPPAIYAGQTARYRTSGNEPSRCYPLHDQVGTVCPSAGLRVRYGAAVGLGEDREETVSRYVATTRVGDIRCLSAMALSVPDAMIGWMDVAVARSNTRGVVGLVGVALALVAVVLLVPHPTPDPVRGVGAAWRLRRR